MAICHSATQDDDAYVDRIINVFTRSLTNSETSKTDQMSDKSEGYESDNDCIHQNNDFRDLGNDIFSFKSDLSTFGSEENFDLNYYDVENGGHDNYNIGYDSFNQNGLFYDGNQVYDPYYQIEQPYREYYTYNYNYAVPNFGGGYYFESYSQHQMSFYQSQTYGDNFYQHYDYNYYQMTNGYNYYNNQIEDFQNVAENSTERYEIQVAEPADENMEVDAVEEDDSVEDKSEEYRPKNRKSDKKNVKQRAKYTPWRREEDEELLKLVDEYKVGPKIFWDAVLAKFSFNRNRFQLYSRSKPEKQNGGGLLTRWLRELRVVRSLTDSQKPSNSLMNILEPECVPDRKKPIYHSLGRVKIKQRHEKSDKRRHSFTEKPAGPERENSETFGFIAKTIQSKTLQTIKSSTDESNESEKKSNNPENGVMMSARPSLTGGSSCITEPYMPAISHSHKASPQSPPMYSVLHDQTSSPQRSPTSPNVPTPPVRDASSLKGIKYGTGHEKYPSWPMAAAAEVPLATRAPPSGGSHRSKSWTEHTHYPKETAPPPVRPYMKRSHAVSNQQLKTVMERSEQRMNSDVFDNRCPRLVPVRSESHIRSSSPPERDTPLRTSSHKELDKYALSYSESTITQEMEKTAYAPATQLTRADLEKYTRSYEEALSTQHVKQSSYAQSEGYHSYVSSTDSTSTPFLDRLRRDSEACAMTLSSSSPMSHPSNREGRDSVATTHSCSDSVNTSNSGSSSETLKWHGSMSDVSVTSSSMGTSSSSRQHIVHSARVKTPQRHNSESVLYIGGVPAPEQARPRSDRQNARLFPVSTYTVKPTPAVQDTSFRAPRSPPHPQLSVAERINELERQQSTRYSFLGPSKRHRISDPALKAIQKKALLSFYERHNNNLNNSNNNQNSVNNSNSINNCSNNRQQSNNNNNKDVWRSEPHLAQQLQVAPQQPPRPRQQSSSRRASSASDYSGWRDSIAHRDHQQPQQPESPLNGSVSQSNVNLPDQPTSPEPSCNACLGRSPLHTCSLNPGLKGPVIVGTPISLDDWVPQRPPKNPLLRPAFAETGPSPEPPPPSPPTVLEDEVFVGDEPFPPPPPEIDVWENTRLSLPSNKSEQSKQSSPNSSQRRNSFANAHGSFIEHRHADIRASVRHRPNNLSLQQRPPPPGCDKSPPPPPLQPRLPRNRMGSQSKASYLALRRDRELNQPNPDHGSYKLTMSPSGEAIDCHSAVTILDNSSLVDKFVNNNGLLQRVSASLSNLSNVNQKVDLRAPCNLPDVLPITAKVPRSRDSPPDSPKKSPKSTKSPVISPPLPTSPISTRQQPIKFSLESTLRQYSSPTKMTIKHPAPQLPCVMDTSLNSSVRSTNTPPSSPKYTTNSNQLSPRNSPNEVLLKCVPQIPSPARSVSSETCKTPPTEPPRRPQSISTSDKSISPLNSAPNSPMSIRQESKSPFTLISSPSSSLAASPASSPPTSPLRGNIEALQLIQRTEVVLRVNTCTSDAASQTEKEDVVAPIKTPLLPRRKSPEELDCERLSRDLASHLSPNDRLHGILGATPDHKQPSDYVNGLFRLEIARPIKARLSPTLDDKAASDIQSKTPEKMSALVDPSTDLKKKKEELVMRLDRKLRVLKEEELSVAEEITVNDQLGVTVGARVELLARASEAAKYRQHIQEVAQITGLLLGLSGRLARVENTLVSLPTSHVDKRTLENKRDKLQEQLEEAKKLKENIDKRSQNVCQILSKYLSTEEFADYEHFINMKAKLIMDSREISNKIQLGEEQLTALSEHV